MRSMVLTAALASLAVAWAAPALAQSETQGEAPAAAPPADQTAAPAEAPNVAEELVVTARYQGRQLRSISVPVSYRDLDLTTEAGRSTLRQRVNSTARDACRRLGEANMGGTAAQPSCERDAMNSATGQMQQAFAQAKPRQPAAMAQETAPAPAPAPAPAAEQAAAPAAAVAPMRTTNGPVPDTPENRKLFGGPNSHAGRRTRPAGN
jgi:UrcA family protein